MPSYNFLEAICQWCQLASIRYSSLKNIKESRRSHRSETTGLWKFWWIVPGKSVVQCFSLQFVYLLGPVVMHYRSILFLILCSTGFDSFCKGTQSSRQQISSLCFVWSPKTCTYLEHLNQSVHMVCVCARARLWTRPQLCVLMGINLCVCVCLSVYLTINSAIKFTFWFLPFNRVLAPLQGCKDYSYTQSFQLRCVFKEESRNYK